MVVAIKKKKSKKIVTTSEKKLYAFQFSEHKALHVVVNVWMKNMNK